MKPDWQQVKALFQRALELEPGQRQAFLDEACGGDPGLRQEVGSLLAAQEQAGSFLESPALSLEPLRPEPPRQIGPYRIVEELGRGGMGVVYLAEHVETSELAALKTVHVERPGHLGRIRREIHALAGIRHPGVVRILANGVHQGLPWYAMELIEGPDLRQYCRAIWDPWRAPPGQSATMSCEAGTEVVASAGSDAAPRLWRREPLRPSALQSLLSVLRRLCVPLAYLHGDGIVHRDLKPGNILVRSDGCPMLVDFGLVSRFTAEVSRESLEVEGAMAGTVAYMAPEQLRGDLVDARADLYAFGCIVYELLTGRPPFLGATMAELVLAHLEAMPLPLSKLVEGVPPELDALVLRLLAKEPRARLGHAADVASVLGALGASNGTADLGPRPRAYLYRPSFAGRKDALAQLEQHLQRLDTGAGGLVLVGGESGVGKTRVVMELAREARHQGVCVLTGECLPISAASPGAQSRGVTPFDALRKPLQALADRCRDGGLRETERLVGPRGRVLALYEPAFRSLPGQEAYPEPVELPPDAARLRLFGFLTETLAAAAQKWPLLLVLDDLQWADDLTLELLAFLERSYSAASTAAPLRLLVVGTYRTEDVAECLNRLLGAPWARRLELGRLDEAAVGSMVGDMLAVAPPPALFVRYLTRHSEGNPFFVAEYLRTAIAEGLLYRDAEGRWQVAEEGGAEATEAMYEALPLPKSLREMVGWRLQSLAPAARQLAEATSVLGREVDAALLEGVAGIPPQALMPAFKELLARQVLEEAGQERFRFVHDKLREVAYERIAEPRRVELHHAAARAIEQFFVRERDEHMAELGGHWERAGEAGRASQCYQAAANRAASRHAYGEAERLYRAYLALAAHPTSEGVAVRNDFAARVLYFQGRNQEAMQQHRAALEEARGLGDRAAWAASLKGVAKVHIAIGQMAEARAACEEGLAVFHELGDQTSEADVLNSLGVISLNEGRLGEARSLYEQARALCRANGERSLQATLEMRLALIDRDRGELEEACQGLYQALALQRPSADKVGEGQALGHLAFIRWRQGRLQQARQLAEEALEIHRETRYRRWEGIASSLLAQIRSDQGHVQEARGLYEQALAILREVQDPLYEAETLCGMAVLERRSGADPARAERLAEEAESISRRLGSARDRLLWLCERGHAALAAGSPGREFLDEARRLFRSLGFLPEGRHGQAIAKLERAFEAVDAGRPLYRGECLEDIPDGFRPDLG